MHIVQTCSEALGQFDETRGEFVGTGEHVLGDELQMCLELFVEVARGRVRERGGGDARGQLGDAYGRFGVEALNGDLVHVGDFGGRAR